MNANLASQVLSSPQLYEKSDSEYICELKAQLVSMSREINSYRQDAQPLLAANAEIHTLKQRILELENALSEADNAGKMKNANSASNMESILQNENIKNQDLISRLRQALIQQKSVESRLVKELLTLRQGASDYETICKKIIACCCDCNEQDVDQIMGPLFNTLEKEGRIDKRMLTSFLEPFKNRQNQQASGLECLAASLF